MSLLLDALNRASKDKTAAEATAQPKATAEWPSISLAVMPPESTPSNPSLPVQQPEPASPAPAAKPLQFPTLGLSLEPVLADLPPDGSPVTEDPPGSGRPIEPTLDDEPLLAAFDRAKPTEFEPPQFVDLALTPNIDPTPPPAQPKLVRPQPAPETAPAPAPKVPPSEEKSLAPPARPAPTSNSAQSSKIAQGIIRAKKVTRAIRTPQPRLLALGAVAGLLSVSALSVLMGWVDPLALLGQGSNIGPVATNTAPAIAEPASVAVEPTARLADGASAPATSVAASPAPQSRTAAASAAPKTGRREPTGTALATPTVTSLPLQASPAPATAPPSATEPVPAAAAISATAVPTASAPVPPIPVNVAVAPAKPASGPTVARPTPRARPAPSQARLSDLPQMLVTAPLGASRLELAYAALTQGRMADAASGYKEILKANPEERDALLGLAYVSHQEGRDEEARDYYKRVLRQEPGNPTARAGLLIQNLSNDAEDVSAGSREVAEQHPGSAAAQSVLGHSLVRQGRLADAQMAFQRAHLLEPAVALHAFNLAVALDRLKSHVVARTYYERALSLSKQSGGEQASGLPHAVVQQRIAELRQATSSNSPAAN